MFRISWQIATNVHSSRIGPPYLEERQQMSNRKSPMEILARQDAPSEADWKELVRARTELLKPYLHSMSLMAVRDVKCVPTNGVLRGVGAGRKKFLATAQKGFGLDTRGIFPNESWPLSFPQFLKLTDTLSSIHFWGLTRDVKWICICVTGKILVVPEEKRCVEVTGVDIQERPLDVLCSICNVSPSTIWYRLGEVAIQWKESRKILYNESKALAEQVLQENLVAKAMPRRW